MNIILVGPPGCGKGTQAARIGEKYGLTYISTGNIIRGEIAAKSQLGIRAKAIIDSGKLLDDQTVLELVRSALSKITGGVLFDGFPRTLAQADALDHIIPITAVLDIQVSDEEVVKRISSRWMVDHNGAQQTFLNQADAQAYVAKNGGRAFQRDDDKEAVVRERLRVYNDQTKPIIGYYGKKHILYSVNGEKSIDNVWADIQKVLSKIQEGSLKR